MRLFLLGITALAALSAQPVLAQTTPASPAIPQLKTTFVAPNSIIVEPMNPDPVRSHIALVVTHPERTNNFNYFHGLELAKYGYRVMFVNYTGPETTYEEFLYPIASGVRALRTIPGIDTIVLAGHSSVGPELTFYQDVAENGPAACQGPTRLYKCPTGMAQGLPKADGVLLLDPNSGAGSRLLNLYPAMDRRDPRKIDPSLDLFDPKNGYDPATRSATYSDAFLKKYFAAQAERSTSLIDEALWRLAKIEKGEGDYKDDEPFVVHGTSGPGRAGLGASVVKADLRILSRTHSPHLLLKADNTQATQTIRVVAKPATRPEDQRIMSQTVADTTVRHYLSFNALRTGPDYHLTEDRIYGVDWRSSGDSMQGNVEGITVPTLIIAATCGFDMGLLEAVFDHSAAKDKEYVGVEGADHNMRACGPQYGDTYRRSFNYMDAWLRKPGRFKQVDQGRK